MRKIAAAIGAHRNFLFHSFALVDGTSVDDRLWLGVNSIGSILLSVGIFRRLKLALIGKRGGA